MALNCTPKKTNAPICVKNTFLANERSRYYPRQHQNQFALDELDEARRMATEADINAKNTVSVSTSANPTDRTTSASRVIEPTSVCNGSPACSVLTTAQTSSARPFTPVAIRSAPTPICVPVAPAAVTTNLPPGTFTPSSSPKSITFRGVAPAPKRSPIPTVRRALPAASGIVRAQAFGTTAPTSSCSVSNVAASTSAPVTDAFVDSLDNCALSVQPDINHITTTATTTTTTELVTTYSIPNPVPVTAVACVPTPLSTPIIKRSGTPDASPASVAISCFAPPESQYEATAIPPTARVSETQPPNFTPMILSDGADINIHAVHDTAKHNPTLSNGYTPPSAAPSTSWLAMNLQLTGFNAYLVQLCEQKLVIELGLVSERIMALFALTEFTAAYLTQIGITVVGLQKHLLALHLKLHAQYTPRVVVTDAAMQDRVRILESTVKALQLAVHEQKIVNMVQQERFDGIVTLLDIHLECQNKKYSELQRTTQKEQSTIEVKKLSKLK